MKRTLLTSLGLSILLATGCASTGYAENASADMGFAGWDADRDGMIEGPEFETGFAVNRWFDLIDLDRNGMLTDEEFGVASADWGIDDDEFGVWDTDDDGMLDDDEFGLGAFSTWDVNRDGMLDDNEFGVADGWFD